MYKKIFIFILTLLLTGMLVSCDINVDTNSGTIVRTSTATPIVKPRVTPGDGTPTSITIEVPAVAAQFYEPSPNPQLGTPDKRGQVAGVLLGLWHGFISPVMLILSFFNNDVQMYEVHNNGNQYNLGFFLGLFFLLTLLFATSRRR